MKPNPHNFSKQLHFFAETIDFGMKARFREDL